PVPRPGSGRPGGGAGDGRRRSPSRTSADERYAPTMTVTPPAALRVALCQLDLVVGDLAGNTEAMAEAYRAVELEGADLALFPELAISGYPPEDLLLKQGFIGDGRAA